MNILIWLVPLMTVTWLYSAWQLRAAVTTNSLKTFQMLSVSRAKEPVYFWWYVTMYAIDFVAVPYGLLLFAFPVQPL